MGVGMGLTLDTGKAPHEESEQNCVRELTPARGLLCLPSIGKDAG